MATKKVVLLYLEQISALGEHIAQHFDAEIVSSVETALNLLATSDYDIVVYDCIKVGVVDMRGCQQLLEPGVMADTPLVVMAESYEVEDKLRALEIGCDDFLDNSIFKEEACTRITKSIFNQIARRQLKSRLQDANQAAHTALTGASDLGANIQFLLAVHESDNLDQLGQQLFHTLSRYGLHCSLQMRSSLGTKNMEAHGMAKDLESQMLEQLANNGRYIDFGSRTIINFERVSLLIKNMPADDADKYGAIKDNTFSLLQGLNARILVLEDKQKLIEEKAHLKRISEDVSVVMVTLKESYQKVMCDIVNEVENVAELIQSRVPTLALTEENEEFLEHATIRAIEETNRIFNDGLVVDEVFAKLEMAIEESLESFEPHHSGGDTYTDTLLVARNMDESGVELF
ncbi:DNA-binding response regulator [Teredinibacter franksiae]|uniref:DNA-binding response regulator n=1 Tax=Teredinibacter franksiae TaxID=2761453 RepID=UPI0016293765|nr:DNA-binding response regulator [Teredinibacter franksiae]